MGEKTIKLSIDELKTVKFLVLEEKEYLEENNKNAQSKLDVVDLTIYDNLLNKINEQLNK